MLMGVRMYANEQNARDAAAKLVEADFIDEGAVFVLTPDPGAEEVAVRQAVGKKLLPGSHARLAVEALRKGRTVVSVPLPYEGQAVLDIMDSCGSVDVDAHPVHYDHDPTPLSDLLGLKVLIPSGSSTRLLTGSRIVFRNFLGLPLLTKSAGTKNSSFGMPLLSRPVSEKDSSFGLPLLSKNGTPLSSMLGLKLLTGPKR